MFLGTRSSRTILSLALFVSRQPASLGFVTPAAASPFVVRSFATSTTTTSVAMSKKVLVPIGDGSEEIETTCITDTLVRFGADVTVASVMNGELLCKMSRGIKVRFQYFLFFFVCAWSTTFSC